MDPQNEFVNEFLREIQVFVINLNVFIFEFLFLFTFLSLYSLFLLSSSPFMLGLFEPLLKSLPEIFHALYLTIPELIHGSIFIPDLSNQSERQLKDMQRALLASHGQDVRIVLMELH